MPLFDGTLTLSSNLDYFEHQGACYVYHNLFGYILQMSEDLVELLEFFRGAQRTPAEVEEAFGQLFESAQLGHFLMVFITQHCLLEEGQDEEAAALKMFPVRARWTVYEELAGQESVVLVRVGSGDEVEEIVLDDWDGAFWRLIDGERTLGEIVELLRKRSDSPAMGLERKALATLSMLTHSDAQFLKLSPRPMSFFRAKVSRRGTPPYLISTMPYRRITEEVRGESDIRVELDATAKPPSPVDQERDRIEATMAHLFRRPHPAFGGRTYGAALCDHFIQSGALGNGTRILEVGGATASLALAMLAHLKDEKSLQVSYHVLVDGAEQAGRLRAAFDAAGQPIEVHVGKADAMGEVESLGEQYDLIFSNEHLANLETVLMSRLPMLDDEEDEEEPEEEGGDDKRKPPKNLFLGEGDGVNLVFKHKLSFDDVDGEFFMNAGAIHFLEQAAERLAPGGSISVIEFGDLFGYPKAAEQSHGTQFSLHFRTLLAVGKSLGMEGEFEWLLARLGADNHTQMLSTNRRFFRCLRHLLARHDVVLEDIAYTQDMFEKLLGDAGLKTDAIHAIEYEALNDRAMGIVPSMLKIVDLRSEGDAAS